VQVTSRQFADVIVAAPAGRVDHYSAAQLEQALLPLVEQSAIDKRALILDFSRVEYISSIGLRVLMVVAKKMHAHDAKVAVAALQPVVAEIFSISRFDRVLGVFPSVRGALERFSAPALEAFDAS
jgi:anti-anti-sigma factor